jgi:hypothetical protein
LLLPEIESDTTGKRQNHGCGYGDAGRARAFGLIILVPRESFFAAQQFAAAG